MNVAHKNKFKPLLCKTLCFLDLCFDLVKGLTKIVYLNDIISSKLCIFNFFYLN